MQSGKYVTSKLTVCPAGTCTSGEQLQWSPLMMGARNHGWLVGFLIDTCFTSALRASPSKTSSEMVSSGCGTHAPRHVSASGLAPSTKRRIPSTRMSSSTFCGRNVTLKAASEPGATMPSRGAMLKCCPKDAACQW
jgi:hypothetical protein